MSRSMRLHPAQRTRKSRKDWVLRAVIQTMPNGAKDKELRALICETFGTLSRTANDYLQELVDSGKLEFLEEEGIWRLPVPDLPPEQGGKGSDKK